MPPRIEGIGEIELRYLHDTEGYSQRNLASYFGVDRSTIIRRLREFGIDPHGKGFNRIYNINQDFFKTWNKESAWLYGWFLGDGYYLYGKKHRMRGIGFSLGIVSKNVLYKFQEILSSGHPVSERWIYKNGKAYETSELFLRSINLAEDLYQISYTDVPTSVISHFIRGFFEAEGSVYWSGGYIHSKFTNNDYDILDFIYFTLKEFCIVEGGGIYPYKKAWYLMLNANRDVLNIYHYMYDDCGDMFLDIKKEKFEELIGRR